MPQIISGWLWGLIKVTLPIYHCRCINKEKPSLSLWCSGHSPLFALLNRGKKQIANLPALGNASRPGLLGLLWKGNNFIRNVVFLAGWSSADSSAPRALVIPVADWSARCSLQGPGWGEPKPAKCEYVPERVQGSLFLKRFLSPHPRSFLWPPISNHSLPSTLSFPPRVHFSSMARFINHVTYLPCLSGLLTFSPRDWGF